MEFQQALNTIYSESQHLDTSSPAIRVAVFFSIASTIISSPSVWDYLEIDEGKRFGLKCLIVQINKWMNEEVSTTEILSLPVCEIVYQAVILMLIKTAEDSEV